MNNILIGNVIEILERIAELLYQENLKEAYVTLGATLPQLDEIALGMDADNRVSMRDNLYKALEAMENQDSILLADIIQYELIEMLQDIRAE